MASGSYDQSAVVWDTATAQVGRQGGGEGGGEGGARAGARARDGRICSLTSLTLFQIPGGRDSR